LIPFARFFIPSREFMNLTDIIIIIPILWAMYVGFRKGFVAQLAGIAGVIAGIWLGFRFGRFVGEWLDMTGDTARLTGFIIVVVATLTGCALLGRLLGGLIKMTGFGMLDTIGGMLVSTLKMLLILSVLAVCFDIANNHWRLVKRSRLEQSRLYTPVMKISQNIFPVVQDVRPRRFGDNDLFQ